jgi:hypothetical protein
MRRGLRGGLIFIRHGVLLMTYQDISERPHPPPFSRTVAPRHYRRRECEMIGDQAIDVNDVKILDEVKMNTSP